MRFLNGARFSSNVATNLETTPENPLGFFHCKIAGFQANCHTRGTFDLTHNVRMCERTFSRHGCLCLRAHICLFRKSLPLV